MTLSLKYEDVQIPLIKETLISMLNLENKMISMKNKVSLSLFKTNEIRNSNGEFEINPHRANLSTMFHTSTYLYSQ